MRGPSDRYPSEIQRKRSETHIRSSVGLQVRALNLCIISIKTIFKTRTQNELTQLGVNVHREGWLKPSSLQCLQVGKMRKPAKEAEKEELVS